MKRITGHNKQITVLASKRLQLIIFINFNISTSREREFKKPHPLQAGILQLTNLNKKICYSEQTKTNNH